MTKNINISLPVLPLLGVMFVIAKLAGQIDWSWWLVTLPFWGLFALGLAFFAILIVVFVLVETVRCFL